MVSFTTGMAIIMENRIEPRLEDIRIVRQIRKFVGQPCSIKQVQIGHCFFGDFVIFLIRESNEFIRDNFA